MVRKTPMVYSDLGVGVLSAFPHGLVVAVGLDLISFATYRDNKVRSTKTDDAWWFSAAVRATRECNAHCAALMLLMPIIHMQEEQPPRFNQFLPLLFSKENAAKVSSLPAALRLVSRSLSYVFGWFCQHWELVETSLAIIGGSGPRPQVYLDVGLSLILAAFRTMHKSTAVRFSFSAWLFAAGRLDLSVLLCTPMQVPFWEYSGLIKRRSFPSERLIESMCHFHHMLLAVVEKYPALLSHGERPSLPLCWLQAVSSAPVHGQSLMCPDACCGAAVTSTVQRFLDKPEERRFAVCEAIADQLSLLIVLYIAAKCTCLTWSR